MPPQQKLFLVTCIGTKIDIPVGTQLNAKGRGITLLEIFSRLHPLIEFVHHGENAEPVILQSMAFFELFQDKINIVIHGLSFSAHSLMREISRSGVKILRTDFFSQLAGVVNFMLVIVKN